MRLWRKKRFDPSWITAKVVVHPQEMPIEEAHVAFAALMHKKMSDLEQAFSDKLTPDFVWPPSRWQRLRRWVHAKLSLDKPPKGE